MKNESLKPKYLQIVLYVALLLLVVGAMVFSRRCSHVNPLAPVVSGNSKGDTVDVAVIYGPMSYYLYGDTVGGVNIDMLNEFASHSKKNLKFWPVSNLHDALRSLEEGTYDILASIPADNTIKNRYLTTESVFLDRLVLIQLADANGKTKVNSALDLAGDTVFIQKDSPAAARLHNLSNEIGGDIIIKADPKLSEEYLCMKVASGDIRLAVVNEKVAEKMKNRYPGLSYANPVSFTQFQVWILSKRDSLLLKEVDHWLSDFLTSPGYRRIIQKYNTLP